jgi:hypothetical protein
MLLQRTFDETGPETYFSVDFCNVLDEAFSVIAKFGGSIDWDRRSLGLTDEGTWE